ncbi:MAG: CheR family methyltransferase [Syntrophobacteraceae bacterium]
MLQDRGKDISVFDETFLMQSVRKRLTANGVGSLALYTEVLKANAEEAALLWGSINISYSEFFRNPFTFFLIEQLVLPALIEKMRQNARPEIRIWSAGCAAGQEAYSLAILVEDLAEKGADASAFRIFATDHSQSAVAFAQHGVYDPAALRNVRLKHIQKYFREEREYYRIADRLKARIDFSVHNLLDDCSICPPASIYGDFDLIFCSNLLFYYRPDIRKEILAKLCKVLLPGGYLITDSAEIQIAKTVTGFRSIAPMTSAVFQRQ